MRSFPIKWHVECDADAFYGRYYYINASISAKGREWIYRHCISEYELECRDEWLLWGVVKKLEQALIMGVRCYESNL